ncbi:Retrovirus-related Pol polyprotein from transposon [Dictyocoela roeselum]|nr:Retrovirus-related Pol polyprotein from transposon [Dictyocoela roeselum]
MSITIGESSYSALVDTGATFNFISETIAETTESQLSALERPIEVETASGEYIVCRNTKYINFKIKGDKEITYKSLFYVFNSASPKIILGMQFLQDNDSIINIRDNYISLDGKEYELEINDKISDSSEKAILDKSKIFTLKRPEEKLKKLIQKMRQDNPEIGHIRTIKHEITLSRKFIPKFKEYSIPIHLRDDIKEHLKKLEELNIIVKRKIKYASPAFPIKKKNNKIRLVIDYRELNKCTIPIEITFPALTDILHSLNGSKVFSTIDLNNGYYQIEMNQMDINKTAFRIFGETYVFLRMPFGLSNAPRTFTKAIKEIFNDLDYVKIYMDDILVHSESAESHYAHINHVLNLLHTNGASINFEKSKFNQPEIQFLGHTINELGIKANLHSFNKKTLKLPTKNKDLQKLLGFMNWFRPFVKNYAMLTTPFYRRINSKEKKIKWTEEEERSFKKLIFKIKENITLTHVQLNQPFTLEVDASNIGMGATLLQGGKIIGFFSATYKKSEINYTISEKELLAILKALTHFRQLVLGSRVTIKTDHHNNLFDKELTSRKQR